MSKVNSYRLHEAQLGMWMAQRLAPAERVFNVAQYLEITGPLEVPKLVASVQEVLARAEPVRVRFVEYAGEVRQIVEPPGGFTPEIIDLSDVEDPELAAMEWMQSDISAPVSLDSAPLYGSAIFKVGVDRHFWYLRAHHSVVDGFSGWTIARRVSEHYSTGVTLRLFPGIEEISADEQLYRESERYDRDRQYWLSELADWPDRSSLSHQNIPGPDVVHRHSAELQSPGALRAAAHQAGTTWGRLAIAASVAYVHQASGADDVVLGMPVTARTGRVLFEAPSMVSNIIPLRVRIDQSMTGNGLLRAVSRAVGHALIHQRYRFEDIRRDHGLGVTDRQLFSAEVNVMSFDNRMQFGSASAVLHNLSNLITEELAITLFGAPDSGALRLDIDGSARRFDGPDLAGHHRRFADMLFKFAHRLEQPLSRWDRVSSKDKHTQFLWNQTRAEIPDATAAQLFAVQATQTPDAVAVYGRRTWTYRDLEARSDELATKLVKLGARPGVTVASVLERDEAAIEVLLAVLKSGAAYVPVDPDWPDARIARVLEVAEPGIAIFSGRSSLKELPRGCVTLSLRNHPDPEMLVSGVVCQPGLPLAPAYIIFTSGSTGLPKGAVVHHRGMVNHLLAKIQDLGLSSSSRVAFNAPLTFDVSVWQMLAALLVGGSTQVVGAEAGQDALQLFEAVAQTATTVVEVVPSQLRAALDAWDAGVPAPDLQALTGLIVNGEVLPPSLCSRWYSRWPKAQITNAYGLTECSDDNTHAKITLETAENELRLPVGRTLRNNQLHLLDHMLRPVPVGMSGELYIGGSGVGIGYHRDPIRTALRYLADPFATEPGSRLYRTGDIARFRADGQLDFLGRGDHQVKIRGNRLELSEVEAGLRTVNGVANALVAVHSLGGVDRLVGYFTGTADPTRVRSGIAALLPDYMVPSALIPMSEFPLNSNGKIDRAAMPAPDFTAAVRGGEPSTPAETALCMAYGEVLGLPEVGVESDFFSLGGDSILAIRVIARAYGEGWQLHVKDLFAHPRIVDLAQVAIPVNSGHREHLPATGPVADTPIFAWLRDRCGPISHYHQSVAIRVDRLIDERPIKDALKTLLSHHPMLRARIDGDSICIPEDSPSASVTTSTASQDLAATVADARTAAVDRLDPANGTMLAVQRVPMRDETILVFAGHHLVVDAVSWRLLLPDFVNALVAAESGQPPQLSAPSVPFRDWAETINTDAKSPLRESELEVWREIVSTKEPTLGSRKLDPGRDVYANAKESLTKMPARTSQALLGEASEAFHARSVEMVLATLAAAVGRWRSRIGRASDRILIDLEGHGRHDPGTGSEPTRTVGWFTCIHPVALSTNCDIEELVKKTRSTMAMIPAEGIGYGQLRYLNERTAPILASGNKSQILFNYLGQVETGLPGSGWNLVACDGNPFHSVTSGADANLSLTHPLELSIGVVDGVLVSQWRWAAELLQEHEISALNDTWMEVIDELTERVSNGAGGHSVSDMPLINIEQSELDDLEADVSEWVETIEASNCETGSGGQ